MVSKLAKAPSRVTSIRGTTRSLGEFFVKVATKSLGTAESCDAEATAAGTPFVTAVTVVIEGLGDCDVIDAVLEFGASDELAVGEPITFPASGLDPNLAGVSLTIETSGWLTGGEEVGVETGIALCTLEYTLVRVAAKF